jgi:hypothetical protein
MLSPSRLLSNPPPPNSPALGNKEKQVLYKPNYAEPLRTHVPRDLTPLRLNKFFDVLKGFDEGRMLHFRPGRYGRVDMFFVREYTVARRNYTIGLFATQPGDDTLAALQALDERVRNDDVTMFSEEAISWIHARSGKLQRHRDEANTAHLYQRRLREQQLLFAGKIKRGHKAFGFFPLDGGT